MYELHSMTPDFPIIFHTDKILINSHFTPHWHENAEILHVISGKICVVMENEKFFARAGETVIINSNKIHQIFAIDGNATYHCLIISVSFLLRMGVDFSEKEIRHIVQNSDICSLFFRLNDIFLKKPPFYKPESCAEALKIAVIIMRNYSEMKNKNSFKKSTAKTEMTKNAITFMKQNLNKPLTLDEICTHLGFTKGYFCHAFKEVTGITAVKMLNFLRCDEAKRILSTSENNVSEAAAKCGFTNLSYFTKTYKNVMGCLPSETYLGIREGEKEL